ncbi:MAG: deoxyribodipyrimidine photo-lyase, partial [Myxococcota bacterium]
MSQPSLVWLRNDLRLDDHMPLQHAIQKSDGQVVVLYCLDPRHFALYPVNARQPLENLPKTGSHRATFIFEALADLRQSLRGLGSDLIIRRGRPEEEVPRLAAALGVHAVTFHEEVCDEELEV